MNSISATQSVIEQLICTTYCNKGSLREKHIFREALQSLVRLAKAEQMLEIRQNIRKAGIFPPSMICVKAEK